MNKLTISVSLEELQQAHNGALEAAKQSAENFHSKHGDNSYCGFSWVFVSVDGRSKESKMLKKIGFDKSWNSSELILWNPSSSPAQSVDLKEAGTKAYIEFMEDSGAIPKGFFRAGSRAD